MATVTNTETLRQQPKVLIIRDERESIVSKGIGSLLGRSVVAVGVAGLLAGAITGAAACGTTCNEDQRLLTTFIGMMMGGAISTTVASAGVRGIQVVADFGVNSTIYALKLPFKAVYIVGSVLGSGLETVYNATFNSSKKTEVTSKEALSLDKKMA